MQGLEDSCLNQIDNSWVLYLRLECIPNYWHLAENHDYIHNEWHNNTWVDCRKDTIYDNNLNSKDNTDQSLKIRNFIDDDFNLKKN